jgi:6-phosphogluconate dehydrogenase
VPTATPLQLGMVGLGRMGANLVRRAMRHGHRCAVYDVSDEAVETLAREGAAPAHSLEELAGLLEPPRAVWVMVPAGAITERAVQDLVAVLDPGDVIIDGGNTRYHDDIRRSAELAARGIEYVDVGTSGGVRGLERGFCLMIGGPRGVFERLEPLFASLAPGAEAAPRTEGRSGPLAAGEQGYLHCGPAGAGHFVKMVHNGIEYGLMAAFAEGFNVLAKAGIGRDDHPADAETAPLADAKYYRYDLDLASIAEVWRRGSVVSSWLLDLTAEALVDDPKLEQYSGNVSDSGEGRWTIHAAVDEGVPAPVLSAALYQRFSSRGRADISDKILSAMRAGFGGHHERKISSR